MTRQKRKLETYHLNLNVHKSNNIEAGEAHGVTTNFDPEALNASTNRVKTQTKGIRFPWFLVYYVLNCII